jgi:hypothetical protein
VFAVLARVSGGGGSRGSEGRRKNREQQVADSQGREKPWKTATLPRRYGPPRSAAAAAAASQAMSCQAAGIAFPGFSNMNGTQLVLESSRVGQQGRKRAYVGVVLKQRTENL